MLVGERTESIIASAGKREAFTFTNSNQIAPYIHTNGNKTKRVEMKTNNNNIAAICQYKSYCARYIQKTIKNNASLLRVGAGYGISGKEKGNFNVVLEQCFW